MGLSWNDIGTRYAETGIDRGVLYVDGLDGVAWNGITSVVESSSGGEARPFYIDGIKYLNLASMEEFAGSIDALYSPEEFDLCDGTLALTRGVYAHQQVRRPFCFSFRSRIANDVDGLDHGYKIHIIYNAMATPATRSYRSLADSSDVNSLSWSITTKPIAFPGLQPTSHVTIDTRKTSSYVLSRLEKVLYGSELEDARVPLPEELLAIFSDVPELTVTDNGDGTALIDGEGVIDNGDGTFTITSDTVVDNGDGTFTVSSP